MTTLEILNAISRKIEETEHNSTIKAQGSIQTDKSIAKPGRKQKSKDRPSVSDFPGRARLEHCAL